MLYDFSDDNFLTYELNNSALDMKNCLNSTAICDVMNILQKKKLSCSTYPVSTVFGHL